MRVTVHSDVIAILVLRTSRLGATSGCVRKTYERTASNVHDFQGLSSRRTNELKPHLFHTARGHGAAASTPADQFLHFCDISRLRQEVSFARDRQRSVAAFGCRAVAATA